MHATTIGVDLAKNRFQLVVADSEGHILERQRISRTRFSRFFANRPACRVVMEACGESQHWARRLRNQGHEVQLLPAQYVRAYVRRNKTDAADAAALIEAARCGEIRPVPIKTVEQQVLQQLHRLREQLKQTRNMRINSLRGCLREFGIVIGVGIARGQREIRAALEIADNGLPDRLRRFVGDILQELVELAQRMADLERQIAEMTRDDPVVEKLIAIPGVGSLIATAARAAVGDLHRFPSGRHFASWLGITARERSSGESRRLGRISKQGDIYLRTLLVHGARSALTAAARAEREGRPLDALRRWALATDRRCGRNKATVALANKLARIIWATWHHQRAFNGNWAVQSH